MLKLQRELTQLVQQGEFHRAVLGAYSEVYTLEVGRHPQQRDMAVVVLSVTGNAPAQLVEVPYNGDLVTVLRESGLNGPGWPL